MGRTVRGRKPTGYEYWSYRATKWNATEPGRASKQKSHRRSRLRTRHLIKVGLYDKITKDLF